MLRVLTTFVTSRFYRYNLGQPLVPDIALSDL